MSPRAPRSLLLLALLCLVPGGRLAAQEPPAADTAAARRPDPVCFRGRSAEHCRAFWITEVSRSTREFGPGNGEMFQVQYEVGGMVNVDPRHAVGATLTTGRVHGGHRGASLRLRRWTRSGAAFDLAPGVMVVGDELTGRRLRLTAHASVTLGDLVGVFTHGESSPGGGQGGTGVKLGSWLGLLVGGTVYVLDTIVPVT